MRHEPSESSIVEQRHSYVKLNGREKDDKTADVHLGGEKKLQATEQSY